MHNSATWHITSLLFFASCMKHEPEQQKHLIPTASIHFTAPLPGSVFRLGEKVPVFATAISSAPLHGFDISIHGATDRKIYYFNHIHAHNDTLVINEQWENFLNTATDLEAEITLYLDHEGHLHKGKTVFRTE